MTSNPEIVFGKTIFNLQKHLEEMAVRELFTGIVCVSVHTGRAGMYPMGADYSWNKLVQEALHYTAHVDQQHYIAVYCAGTLIATLKGEC